MAKFYGTVMLYVNLFDADDIGQANEMMNDYIDVLAKTGGQLRWEEVDANVYEETEGE
jgi:hypothetical protein